MTSAQLISWVVSAITFGTVIMFGCIGETINQKAGNLNLGVPIPYLLRYLHYQALFV